MSKRTQTRIKLRITARKRKRKQPKGLSEFGRDVKILRKISECSQEAAVREVRRFPKWVNRRWDRMSEKRKKLAGTNVTEPYGHKGIKQTIIERAMYRHGIKDMNRAKDWWEARGSK